MTRIMSLIWVALLLGGGAVSALGGDKYDEAAGLVKHYLPVVDHYLAVVEKSNDPVRIAGAMNQLADAAEELAPKVAQLRKKYPELEAEQKVPARYAPLQKQAEARGQRLVQSFARVLPFLQHPQVAQANSRILGIMTRLGAI